MSPKIRRMSGAAATLALVGGVFSLLIWGKLRLVGGVPRSAYAEPAPSAPQPASQAPAEPGADTSEAATPGEIAQTDELITPEP